MQINPYWSDPKIGDLGLTDCILSSPRPEFVEILRSKRRVAKEACKLILKENPDAELVAILGSVALGDIIGWFSDIDLLAIGESLPEKEKFMVLEHEPLFIEYHRWRSFENLLTRRLIDIWMILSGFMELH